MTDELRKGKSIKSAFDSTTFEADVSIHVDRKVGSATISPSGRDVALASYVPVNLLASNVPKTYKTLKHRWPRYHRP